MAFYNDLPGDQFLQTTSADEPTEEVTVEAI